MSAPANCFGSCLRMVSSHGRTSKDSFDKCVSGSSRTQSSKTSPTHSGSKLARLVLLTLSAALPLHSQTLAPVATHDAKIRKRWARAGDPHGVAAGPDGTLYVGLAQPQAVVAIDPKTGAIKKRVVLDSAEIASTKELVTLRISGARLFIANGSDESATILSLPDLAVLREITIEGEPIRDALPDPRGRYLYLLGRRVHVYDAAGERELHALGVGDPTAIAANGKTLAVVAAEGTVLFDTSTFAETRRMKASGPTDVALFANDALVTTERAGYLTIYKVPHAAVVH